MWDSFVGVRAMSEGSKNEKRGHKVISSEWCLGRQNWVVGRPGKSFLLDK